MTDVAYFPDKSYLSGETLQRGGLKHVRVSPIETPWFPRFGGGRCRRSVLCMAEIRNSTGKATVLPFISDPEKESKGVTMIHIRRRVSAALLAGSALVAAAALSAAPASAAVAAGSAQTATTRVPVTPDSRLIGRYPTMPDCVAAGWVGVDNGSWTLFGCDAGPGGWLLYVFP